MNLETRNYLLADFDPHADSWLDVEDTGSNFEMRVRTDEQTFDMLRHAYGLKASAKETLKVHLEGDAAELAGVDKALESVQTAVRNLFAEAPFNVELKLTGIEPGSTVLVYEPAESDVQVESVLGDDRVEVASSSASRAATEAIKFLRTVEDHSARNSNLGPALRRAHQLSQELRKLELEAEFAWRSYNGESSFTRFTNKSATFLGRLDQDIDDKVTTIGVQGPITEIALDDTGLYRVTVRSSLAPRAHRNEVLIDSSAFKSLGKFIGDVVSWSVKKTVRVDGFGETVGKRLEFVAEGVAESEPDLFSAHGDIR